MVDIRKPKITETHAHYKKPKAQMRDVRTYAPSMQSLAKDMNKGTKPRVGAVVQSAMTHTSPAKVRSTASKVRIGQEYAPVSPQGKDVIFKASRIVVERRGGGWVRATYTDPNARRGPITFNVRESELKKRNALRPATDHSHPAEDVYSAWIHSTKKGEDYTMVRGVEGMIKVYRARGDDEAVAKLEKLLEKSDKEIAKWRREWLASHSEEEIKEFYDYEEEEEVW